MINNQRIMMTGSSGFIGLNLIQHLSSQAYQIDKLNLRNNFWQSNIGFEYNAIIHLAGKAHDLKNVANPDEYYKVNYELTKQLFDIFLESSASVFVFMSSVKAVADAAVCVLTEEFEANPQTHYGLSKYKAEKYILSKKLPVGKRLYILRPCMIHGPDNKGNLNLLYKLVSKGIPWPLGAFENKRSFCSIDNVCFVVNEILDNRKIPSGIYNLADDQAISTNRLIELISITQNKLAKIYKIPKKFIITLAKICDYLKLPLNSERLEKLTENFEVSNDKIVKAIGKKLPVSAEDGLIRTFNSFK